MRSLRLAALFAAAALSLPVEAAAQLAPLSEAFPIAWPRLEPGDVYTLPYTSYPGIPVAVALSHGFAVASLGSTSSHDEVIDGKLVDLSGEPGPGFFGAFLGNGAEPVLRSPAIAATGPGGFVLVWTEAVWNMMFQRFGPGAAPIAGWVGESSGVCTSPAVAGNAAGSFAVAWQGCFDSSEAYVRAFSPSGAPATGELILRIPPRSQYLDAVPRVGMDAAGRFAVIWRQAAASAGAPTRLCGQAYGARGGFLGSPFCIGDLAGSTGGALAVDPAGSFLAAWFGPAAAGGPAPLFVRRYQMNGTPAGDPVQIAAASHPSQLNASADHRGNAALSWREGDQLRVLLVRRDAVARGPAIAIAGAASHPEVDANGAALGDSGRLLVTWKSGDLILGQLWQARF